MKKIAIVLAIAVCLGIAFAAGLPAQNDAPAPAAAAPTWQHLAFPVEGGKVFGNPQVSRQINQLGRDGYELVDVETIEREGTTVKTVFFFKKVQ